MAGKGYFNTEISQMALLVPFSAPYHTKQLNLRPNLPTSCVVNYSRLSTYPEEMKLFKNHPSTHGCPTSLRNKPQQKQPGQLSVPMLPEMLVTVTG